MEEIIKIWMQKCFVDTKIPVESQQKTSKFNVYVTGIFNSLLWKNHIEAIEVENKTESSQIKTYKVFTAVDGA